MLQWSISDIFTKNMTSATSTISATDTLANITSKLYLNPENRDEVTNERTQISEKELSDIKEKLHGKNFSADIYGIKVEVSDEGLIHVPQDEIDSAKYPDFLPTWDPTEKYEAYTEFEWEDKGLKAHPELKNLFPEGLDYKKKNLTPKFGTEIRGIQLSALSSEAKNDLAKYVAQRGVLIFRDQDLASKGPKFAAEYGEYFGPQHIHPTSGAPESTSKIHIVYKPLNGIKPHEHYLKTKNKALTFHSDISYEKQPPSITFLALLEGPETGGDTVFVDTVEAYKRLSPEFQEILRRLKAVHQGVEQANRSRETLTIVRRAPSTKSHPVVRTISSTGEKALYINSGFVSEIEGLKKEESDAILGFLYDLLHSSVDLHIRAGWEEGTIVVWDNRRTEHTALFDWDSDERRHLFRITPRAEIPFL